MKGRAGRRVAGASTTPALGADLRGGCRFPPGENARPAPGAPGFWSRCEAARGRFRRRAQTLALERRVCLKTGRLEGTPPPHALLDWLLPEVLLQKGFRRGL